MTTYKLTYFNFRGAAETTRHLFAVAEQEYEDIRIEKHQWAKLKPETPLGHLPVLNVDGKDISQVMAIHRYLARKFNLYGDNDFEKAQIDMVIDVVQDLYFPLKRFFYAETDEMRAHYKKQFVEVDGPKYVGYLEKLLKSNGGGDGFFVGSKVSLADIIVFVSLYDLLADSSKEYYLEVKEPKVKALMEKIRAMPQIDAWWKKRPQVDVVFSL